ncbi:hypothetical protein ABHV46_13630 [Asaia sp. BMEF1]|uniref:hypothetical protein n=1 Tax=Asaia sp. BMEF1 TaxID=3155932 RepID=UPI003F680005
MSPVLHVGWHKTRLRLTARAGKDASACNHANPNGGKGPEPGVAGQVAVASVIDRLAWGRVHPGVNGRSL